MVEANFPHEEIRQNEDRSWSLKLLNTIVASKPDDDLKEIARTLEILDDQRVMRELTQLIENQSIEERIRILASDILYECATDDTAEQRARWWSSGDKLLMRHAVRMAEEPESKLIEKLASDPDHPFHIDAVKKLSRFEQPRFQRLAISALSHSDPKVRTEAADLLLWDQPVAAEAELLRVAEYDEYDPAAEAALDTLAYYESQTALLKLYALSTCGPSARRPLYKTVFEWIQSTFISELEHLDGPAAGIFRNWLKPSLELLELDVENHSPDSPASKESPSKEPPTSPRPSVDQFMDKFDNCYGVWADRWNYVHKVDWNSYSPEERARLTGYFSTHPDWSVRELTCQALAVWNSAENILKLLDDPLMAVRKMAAYYARELSPNPAIAKRLWEFIECDGLSGTRGSEALSSYVVHADKTNLDSELFSLARYDERESIRSAAIGQLRRRKATPQLRALLPLLREEPLVTWSSHWALLEACLASDIEIPNLTELMDVDDLHLQVELAEYLAKHQD